MEVAVAAVVTEVAVAAVAAVVSEAAVEVVVEEEVRQLSLMRSSPFLLFILHWCNNNFTCRNLLYY